MLLMANNTWTNARSRLLIGASVIAVAVPNVSLAQASASESAPAVSSAQNPRAAGNEGVEEIIVTAQRREQSQQAVPISITTVSAKAALRAGITGTEGLGIAVPSLQFGRNPTGAVPFLRGVGTDANQPNVESPVSVYIDDVYIGSPQGTLLEFNNIDTVEVLKGPQGTLFGRNATGGLVHVHTKRPSHDTSLNVTAGYGNYDTYSGNLYGTTGLSDNVAVSFAAVGTDQRHGYGRLVETNEDIYKQWNYAFRSQLLWEPSNRTTVLLTGDYSRLSSDIGINPAPAPGTKAIGGAGFPGRYKSTNNPSDSITNWGYGFSGKVTQDLGSVSLVSISAYRRTRQDIKLDSDGSLPGAPPILTVPLSRGNNRSFSQEVQLLSNSGGPFSWIAGGFYYHVNAGFDPVILAGSTFAALGGSSVQINNQILNSYSGFGEASYALPSNTKLTIGLRYTTDQLKENVLLLTGTGAVRAPSPFHQEKTFSKLTYRAILDQKIGDAALLYASYSRGFRSGSFNLNGTTAVVNGVTVPTAAVSPEVIDAYEIGVKSDWFDRKLRVNLSTFYYDYGNLQVTSIVNASTITVNAAKAQIKGIDLDVNFVPSRRLNISGGLAILDAKFKEFPAGPLYVPNPGVCTPTPMATGPATGGYRTCTADLAGNAVPRSPKFTASIAATYTLPTAIGEFALNGSLYHNSGFVWALDNQLRQPSYNLVNTSLNWTTTDKKYEVRFQVKNLFNQYYFSFASENTSRFAVSPAMPRSYGISATAHF
jgi:iron complex outermembrane receptor protein